MKHFKEGNIVEAKILNLDTGEEISLLNKPDREVSSKCLFVPEEVLFGEFIIRLRFDWGDLNRNGDPSLDADITKNGRKYKDDKDKWHHTFRELKNNLLVYHFKFENLELQFKLVTTNDKEITAKAYIVKCQ